MSTKIHACVDALGNAVRLLVTGGQVNDSSLVIPLRAGINAGRVIADTAYDSDENRPNRTELAPFDEAHYEDRNKTERFFNRVKRFRRSYAL